MTNRQHRRAAALALALAAAGTLAALPARADSIEARRPGVSLGGRAAYFWPDGVEADKGEWMGGAQVRVYLAKFFAVEGSADYRQERFNNASTIADIYPVQVSGLLYLLPNSPFTPFLLGGVGWYFTSTTGPSGFSDTQNRFGSHVGGGVQLYLSKHWSLDATYRYLFTERIKTFSNGASVSVNADGQMVTGGVNFHF